jgi:ABC-type glycerol-3-phosphate transport system permease component
MMKKQRKIHLGWSFWIYVLLFAGMIIVTMPMVYMVSTSLKPNGALYEYPPHFLSVVENS